MTTTPPDTVTPAVVAPRIGTTEQGLAQMRYRRTGPPYIKVGRKVLYRWSDVNAYLDANTVQCADNPRGAAAS